MANNTQAFLITCLTNLHVGSEGVNYGVVDKLVQRDTITNNPVINSSSLKGALREFFKDKWGESEKLRYIFGVDNTRETSDKKDAGIGHYKFLEAKLLSIPMRSDNKPFYNVTTKYLIDEINNQYTLLNGEAIKIISGSYANENKSKTVVRLEDWTTTADPNFAPDSKIGTDVATLSEDIFKKVVKQLPVLARNKLDNGTSKNLWYEEVVPRESRFVFFVIMDGKHEDDFIKEFENNYVQIGGNGSVGYGFTKIIKIG
jgi:CRISPR-associated protein Cmr4